MRWWDHIPNSKILNRDKKVHAERKPYLSCWMYGSGSYPETGSIWKAQTREKEAMQNPSRDGKIMFKRI